MEQFYPKYLPPGQLSPRQLTHGKCTKFPPKTIAPGQLPPDNFHYKNCLLRNYSPPVNALENNYLL